MIKAIDYPESIASALRGEVDKTHGVYDTPACLSIRS